jgi:polyisoprenoid-binding protein YceI
VTFGPGLAAIEVLVFREGFLSAVGHDLRLRATAFEIAVDPERRAVAVRVDAASLRVASAMRDGRALPDALSPSDVREIEDAAAARVLRASRFPLVRFDASGLSPCDGGYEVRGVLALAGTTRPLVALARREGDRLVAEVAIQQPHFGIAPYRAMLGALRVKAEVLVRVSVPAAGF